eukprot:1985873-Rhodomonas_salina.1
MAHTFDFSAITASVPDFNTSLDVREAAEAFQLSDHALSLLVSGLKLSISSVLQAHANPAARPFKLAYTNFVPSIDLLFSSLLAEQRAHTHSRSSLQLYTSVLAWTCALQHCSVLDDAWNFSGSLADTFWTSVAQVLRVAHPRAMPCHPSFSVTINEDATISRLRVSVYSLRVQLAALAEHTLHLSLDAIMRARLSPCETLATRLEPPQANLRALHIPPAVDGQHELTVAFDCHCLYALASTGTLAPLLLPDVKS